MTWPDVYIEAAFGADPSSASSGWTWSDLSSRCERLDVRSPRRVRLLDRYSPGQIVADLDNSDRALDPFNLSGPYVSGGVTQVRPRLPVRVRVVYSATTYHLARCHVDDVAVRWDDPAVSTATISATDAFKLLNVNRVAVDPAVGESDSTSQRIGRILDGIGWPASERSITSTDTRMTATTLGGDALAELQTVADHEHSDLHIDGQGRVRFTARSGRYSTSTRTFSDAGGGALEYADLTAATDDDLIINDAAVSNAGGSVFTATDATSIARYGRSTYAATNFAYSHPGEPDSWARAVVLIWANHVTRFAAMELRPDVDDALWVPVLSAQLGDRITITRTPPGGGSAITRQCFIEGMSHRITPVGASTQGTWVTTWTLSDASSWPAITPAKWGTAKWGTADWLY